MNESVLVLWCLTCCEPIGGVDIEGHLNEDIATIHFDEEDLMGHAGHSYQVKEHFLDEKVSS